ncbi:MAG: GIY-YIG nuclease family protein [Candidatus Omnitrophica bacterium]|nr:GIY-YIG nuclease family protein [Candidatus Omnitrophota bacterium]
MKEKFIRKQLFYVYILECQNGTYYAGYTNNLERRTKEHGNTKRGAKYLRGKGPVKLVYVKEYKYFKRAVSEESRIKKLRRYQKKKLIDEFKR